MARKTKEQLLKSISRNVKGVYETPTGNDLTYWGDVLDEVNEEWNQTYDFQNMISTYRTTVLQSGTSIALPNDFKEKFAGYIDIGGDPFQEIDPVEATLLSGTYVKWGGNYSDGYYLEITPATSSVVEAVIKYHSRVTSLSTLTAISKCPDDTFLINRTSELILLEQEDTKYLEYQNRADLALKRMVAMENSTDFQKNNQIRSQNDYNGFIIGDD